MLRTLTPSRCLILLAAISGLLLFTLVPRYELLDSQPAQIVPRQLPVIGGGGGDSGSSAAASSGSAANSSPASSAPSSTPTSQASSSTSEQQPSSTSPSSAPPSGTSDTSQPTSAPSNPASDTQPTGNNSTPPPNNQSAQPSVTPPPVPTVSQVTSVNQAGETIILVTTVTPSYSAPSASQSQKANQDSDDDGGSKGVSTATIVGLSVAGGIALFGIIGFVVWKFTRKRFSDSDFDDNEAIKWPELNTHGEAPHALPTHTTGNFGMETNSEVNLTRPDSRAGSFAPSASASAVDLYAAQDPYAVPPLPHMNPNQPYRDDPHGGFYDPYSGPVPQAFTDADAASMGGPEAIPMTQINRARSPGPATSYDMGGRASPGPHQAYYAGAEQGRASPGPRAMSPGPHMALGGRASPGPQMAYGAYGGRQSPGPHAAYGGGQ